MIPSYDDLTPGIPDVVDAETVKRLEIFFYRQLPSPPRGLIDPTAPAEPRQPPAPPLDLGSSPQLYACLACERPTADRQPHRSAAGAVRGGDGLRQHGAWSRAMLRSPIPGCSPRQSA